MSETFIRWSLGACVPIFGIIGLIAAQSPEGPQSGIRLIVSCVVVATTVPVTLVVIAGRKFHFDALWWSGGKRGRRDSMWFVVYADVGVAIVLFMFADHEMAMVGTSLFAVVSVFVAHFVPLRVVLAHVGFTSATILVLAYLAWRSDDHDLAAIVARALVQLLAVNGCVVLLSTFSRGVQRSLRTYLDEALTDPLTGLLNRRGFQSVTSQLLTRGDVAVVILDVDNFKAVNDIHGHDVGDTVLRLLARRLHGAVDPTAAVARTGGEEFAIAVVSPADHQIAGFMESIRAAVHDPADDVPITVSAGVATLPRPEDGNVDDQRLQDAIRRALVLADAAMYAAKTTSRTDRR